MDSWKEAIEKTVNAKVKALLQSFSSTCKIDSKYARENKPAKKEEKDSEKNKSTNSASTDISSGKQSFSIQQASFINPKKDQKHHRGLRHERGCGRGQDSPATDANVIFKKENVDLSQVESFNYKKKSHYAN